VGKLAKHANLLFVIGLSILTIAFLLCEDQMTFTASVFGFPLIAIGFGFLVVGAISPKSFYTSGIQK
jgi:hypothetical protein